MVSVSQFPLSVIAIFICRVLIWLVFQFFLGVIVNSSCDTEGGRGTKVADVVFLNWVRAVKWKWYVWPCAMVCWKTPEPSL